MADINPYAAPRAPAAVDDDQSLRQVASGQKLIIYSLLASLATVALRGTVPVGAIVALVVGLATSVVAVLGAVRVGGGLGHSVASRIFYAVMMFVPIANLVFMIGLSMRATSALRKGGYRVGLLGAKLP